jgi:UrcA family protein
MNTRTHRSLDSLLARTTIGSLALSALLVITPAAVIAGPQHMNKPQKASAKVSLADLDLTTPAGISEAHQRLAAAAKHLCREFSDSRRISDHATFVDCYRDTLASATQDFTAQLEARGIEGTQVARNVP